MFKSIIKDIFNGKRGCIDNIKIPEELKLYDKIISAYNKLKEQLSPEIMTLINNYEDILNESVIKEIDFYFTEGFKLGLLIGIECND